MTCLGNLLFLTYSDNFLLRTMVWVASIATFPVLEILDAFLIGGKTFTIFFLFISTYRDGVLEPITIKSGLNFSSNMLTVLVMILVNWDLDFLPYGKFF